MSHLPSIPPSAINPEKWALAVAADKTKSKLIAGMICWNEMRTFLAIQIWLMWINFLNIKSQFTILMLIEDLWGIYPGFAIFLLKVNFGSLNIYGRRFCLFLKLSNSNKDKKLLLHCMLALLDRPTGYLSIHANSASFRWI